MSGLLQALGAQAMNAVPSLRPAARRPSMQGSFQERSSVDPELHPFEAPMQDDVAAIDTPGPGAVPPRQTADIPAIRQLPRRAAHAPETRTPGDTQHAARPDAARGRGQPRPTLRPQAALRPRERTLSLAAPRPYPGRASNAVGQQVPDIHIHIGRIDVAAAVPVPATPKRERKAPAGRSIPLEDYLRRGTGSP